MDYYWLNLYDIFVNNFAGSVTIFIALALLVLATWAAKFRFPNIVTITIFVIFFIIIGVTMNPAVLALPFIAVGVYLGWGIIRFIRRE